MAANSNNLPHPDDMESPRATPDHFRQPTGGATGYEVASRSQSGHSDGGFESKPATIGKPPNKHSPALLDDMTDVKPGIMEMIQEERRVSEHFFANQALRTVSAISLDAQGYEMVVCNILRFFEQGALPGMR